jgi:acyl-coenzyme A thioesterase PaaI-like protein
VDATRIAAALLEPIPANRAFGIEVLSAVDGSAEVALVVAPEFHNVIGSLHSSGLVALLDATALAAIVAAAADERELRDLTPLGSTAHAHFLAPARGRLVGRCTLTDQATAELRALLGGQQRKAQLETLVEISDADDAVVCRGTFTWKLRRGH